MTRRLFNTVLFSLIVLISGAQSYTISGELKDESANAVAYANIIVSKLQDSSLVDGTTSDEMGKFQILGLKPDQYIVSISFIGYETYSTQVMLDSDKNLGTVILKESAENLEEVSILAKKPTLRRESDRLVFNIQNTTLSEGNIMDAIKRTPGVLVLEDAISIKGMAPTIYINDRKVNLSSQDVIELLEGTTASNIKSIEVITNPSARYDADSGTVLNIVMSRNLVTGYNGSVYSNYTQGVFPRYSFGTSNFFKSKKFNAFLNYGYNKQKINRENEESVVYPDEVWNTNLNRNTWSETHVVNGSLDYSWNENNSLSFSTNMSFLPYFKYLTRSRTNIKPIVSTPFAGFQAKNLSRDIKKNLGFSLDYEHIFKNKSKLILNSLATFYDYRRNQSVNSDYFDESESFLFSNAFRTRSDQDTQILTAQADYILPISENSGFEAGAKISNVQTESALIQRNIIDGNEVFDPDNSDAFDYDETVYAAYVNYERSTEKWSFRMGVRAEQTDIIGQSASTDNDSEQNYLEWFPSVSLSYQLGESTPVYANYKRSIERPRYYELNPFKFFLNDNTIVTGNPALQPIFIDHVYVGTELFDLLTFEVYYREYDGYITELPVQDNNTNIVSYTPVNFDLRQDFGIDFLANFSITNSWSVSALTSTYYIKEKFTFNDQLATRDRWANYSEVISYFTFLKDRSLNVDLTVTYISENIQGLQVVDTRIWSQLALKKTIMKGKGVLSLTFQDLFNKQDFFVATQFLNQNSTNFANFDNRHVRVGFRYNFGNTRLSGEQKGLPEEERERLEKRN